MVMVLTIVNIVVKITMFCTAVVILLAVIIMTWRRSFDACRIFLMTIVHHWSGDGIISYHHQSLWLIQWFWQWRDAAPYDDHYTILWWSSYHNMMIIIWQYDDHHMEKYSRRLIQWFWRRRDTAPAEGNWGRRRQPWKSSDWWWCPWTEHDDDDDDNVGMVKIVVNNNDADDAGWIVSPSSSWCPLRWPAATC